MNGGQQKQWQHNKKEMLRRLRASAALKTEHIWIQMINFIPAESYVCFKGQGPIDVMHTIISLCKFFQVFDTSQKWIKIAIIYSITLLISYGNKKKFPLFLTKLSKLSIWWIVIKMSFFCSSFDKKSTLSWQLTVHLFKDNKFYKP